MAYDLKEKNQDAQAMGEEDQVDADTPNLASASGGPSSKTTAKSAPQATPAQPFQNLQSYLTANAPQVEAQAGKIAGDLTNQYGQVKGDIDKGQQDFAKQVQGGYAQPNEDIVNRAATNPTAFVQKPEDVSGFQALYNDTYRGPSNYESSTPYANLSQEVGTAANNATNFNSIPGMKTYFKGQSPTSTAGGNTLDAVLLQGNANALKTVQGAAKPFGTLNDYLNGTVTTADQGVTAAQKSASDTASSVQNRFTGQGGVIPSFQQGLSDRLNQTSKTAQDAATRAKTDLLAGNPTADDYKVLGIQPGQMNEIQAAMKSLAGDYGQNFDLNNYATMQSPDTVFGSVNSIATPEDYAKSNALSKLTGQDLSSFLNPSLAGNAGKQNNSLLDFNKEGAQGDANTALKQNDMDQLNKHLNFTDHMGNQKNYTLDQLLKDTNARNDALYNINDPTERAKFRSALGRYLLQTGGPQGPQAPADTPVGFQPVSSSPGNFPRAS